MMLTLELPNEQVRVETIVEAREAAIIYMNEEAAEGTLTQTQFNLRNQDGLIGVVAMGIFFPYH